MIEDFRRNISSPLSPLLIDGRIFLIDDRTVEMFSISSLLVLQSLIILNGSKMLILLSRRLRSFGLTTHIRLTFYRVF